MLKNVCDVVGDVFRALAINNLRGRLHISGFSYNPDRSLSVSTKTIHRIELELLPIN